MTEAPARAGVVKPRLHVVIVSYRCRDPLERCLESLVRYPPRLGEMVIDVVDNASGDGTIEMVRSQFPGVGLRALERNSGFSYANNLVLRTAIAEFCLLLNPDTAVTEGALDRLLELIGPEPDVGMVGPRLVRDDGTFDHAAKRGFPTPLSALGHFTGIGRTLGWSRVSGYRATELSEHARGRVDAINGAFMLVRRTAMLQVGLLDEGYWLYMEDLDWCYRFNRAGWKILYDGTTTVIHTKGASSGRFRALRPNIAFHRGMGRFYRTHYAGSTSWLDALVYLGIGGKLAVSLCRGALDGLRVSRVRAH